MLVALIQYLCMWAALHIDISMVLQACVFESGSGRVWSCLSLVILAFSSAEHYSQAAHRPLWWRED